MTRFIINADDFGLNRSCTNAIYEAFNKELITDTTMISNGDAFDLAVIFAKENDIGDNIGIHFNLTEGIPLTDDIKLCSMFTKNGQFIGRINRFKPLSEFEKQAVYEELTAQIKKIESAGIKLTHADSHHHIHTAIFVAPIVFRVCKEHGINKIRIHRNIGKISFLKKMGKRIYNLYLKRKGFTVTDFMGSLEDAHINSPEGILEIMVHPDYDQSGALMDKIDTLDNYAVGENLSNVLSINHDLLYSYKFL